MQMNQLRPEQQFLEPLDDPSAAAMLVTLGFPLQPGGHEVRLTDLSSAGRAGECARAWTLGRVSPKAGDARLVLAAWRRPLPELEGAPAALNAAAVCKLALHNRRCLMLQVQQGLPLFAGSAGAFGRLGNWAMAGAHAVPEMAAGPVNVCDTLTAAVAATCGLQVAGHFVSAGRHGWLVLPGPEGRCSYQVEQVLQLVNDADYISANDDTLALAAGVLHNRSALLQGGQRAGALNVLHRNGRYAVISAAANRQTQMAAARHLNI